MIVVKIELHSAITGKITTIGQAIIHNVTEKGNHPNRGDYEVLIGKKTDVKSLNKVFNNPLRKGEVKNYPRLSYNVWRLIIRALLSAFPEESKNAR